MDRLSDVARTVVEDFRGKLNPDAARVERNWAAIERRALVEVDATDDLYDDPNENLGAPAAKVGAGHLGVSVGTLAVGGAACAAVAIAGTLWWSGMQSRDPTPAREAAAYQHDEVANGAALVQECPPAADTGCPARGDPAPLDARNEQVVVKPEAAPKRSSSASKRRKAASTPSTVSDLNEEIAIVRDARAALRDGDTARALRALEEHAQRFQRGEFVEEATVLRITALCRAGKIGKGLELTERFLESHGHSPLAGQAAQACESARPRRP